MKKIEVSMNKRTPKDSPAVYYSAIAERFSEIIAKKDKNIKKIYLDKMDSRGSFSITFEYEGGTTAGHKYFKTYRELFAYIEGYIAYKK